MSTWSLRRNTIVTFAALTVLAWAALAVSSPAATKPTKKPTAVLAVTQNCADKDNGSGSAGVFTSPGPGPGYTNRQIATLGFAQQISLTCHYYNNVGQGKWYAELPGGSFGYKYPSYVWVQRLVAGSRHECVDGGGNGSAYSIGSSQCPLTNVN